MELSAQDDTSVVRDAQCQGRSYLVVGSSRVAASTDLPTLINS